MLRALAVAAGASACLCAAAAAATPTARLEAKLKSQLQGYYVKANPAFKMTSVTCKIAPAGTSATCSARFTVKPANAAGVFGLAIKINRSTGALGVKTVSDVCTNTKTHAKIPCQ